MTDAPRAATRGLVMIAGAPVHFECGRAPVVGEAVVVIDRAGHLVVSEHLGPHGCAPPGPWLTHVRLAGSPTNVRDIVPLVGIVVSNASAQTEFVARGTFEP